MPSSSKDHVIDRGSRSPVGVGAGEPLGEPAPPPGILEAMGEDLRAKLPDELVDELLAGTATPGVMPKI